MIFLWASGVATFVALSYLLFDRQIVAIYTNNATVAAVTTTVYLWVVIAPFVNSFCFIWDGVYIGATATRAMLVSMLLATLVFYLPVYYLTRDALGNHALWLAMTTFMAVRGLSLTIYASRAIKVNVGIEVSSGS